MDKEQRKQMGGWADVMDKSKIITNKPTKTMVVYNYKVEVTMKYKNEQPIIFDEYVGLAIHFHDLKEDDRLYIETQAHYNVLSKLGDLDNWKLQSVKLGSEVIKSTIIIRR